MIKRYVTIFNFLALSVLLFIGVDLFYKIVGAQLKDVETQEIAGAQVSPVKRNKKPPLSSYRAVTDRNIFGSLENAAEEIESDFENLEPTKLKLALVGTAPGTKQISFAVIEETDKRRQGLYRVGDSVKDATLKAILWDKVVLSVGGKDEILTMEESSSKSTSSSSVVQRVSSSPSQTRTSAPVRQRTIRRSDIQKATADISSLAKQARITPATSDDGQEGLAISNIQAGSIFTRMGLRSGDIVQGVDNNPISGTEDLISLYQELNSASSVTLDISRNGQKMSLPIRIR